jgi:hypothetical protein
VGGSEEGGADDGSLRRWSLFLILLKYNFAVRMHYLRSLQCFLNAGRPLRRDSSCSLLPFE